MKKILLLLILFGYGFTANAEMLVLQPGPSEGKDVVAGTSYYTNNTGDLEMLYVGGWGDYYASYIYFDLSSIPTDAAINNAIFTVYEYTTNRNLNNFRYTKILAPWDELTVSNQNRPQTASTSSAWVTMANTGPQSLVVTDIVQDWVSSPGTNYGIMIDAQYGSNNQARGFRSSDYAADPTLRPKLVIEYTVPTSTIPTFITLSEDAMTEISNDIEYPAILPVYQGLMNKVVQAYERGHLVRADRRLERFQSYIKEGLGRLLFTKTERRSINTIINDMRDILVTEG